MNETIRAILVVVLCAASLARVNTSAVAEPRQVFFGAPYASSSAEAFCTDVLALTGTCDPATASADATTGVFSMHLGGVTRDGGESPGLLTASGRFVMSAWHARATPAPALLYVLTLALTERTTTVTGVPVPLASVAELNATAVVRHATCEGCTRTTMQTLGTSVAPSDPGTVQMLAMIVNPSGADVPAGTVGIELTIEGTATLVGIGDVEASLAGALTQIEVAAPSGERLLGAPYAAAGASRSCDGGTGTTFNCFSAAAKTTGRVKMDLEVISPVAGTAPGQGQASGVANIGVDDTAGAVRAVAYILDMSVTSADAYVPQNQTPVLGLAEGYLDAVTSLLARECTRCETGNATAAIVNARDRVFRLDDNVPFVVWMTTDGLTQTPRGAIDLEITGTAVLRNTAGQALVRLDATVASVRAIEIA